MKISETAISRRIMTLMGVLALILLGGVTVFRIPLNLMPEIDFPFVMVRTILPGAAPDVIESDVTDKIEEAISEVSGIKNLTSTSIENISMVMIEFEVEEDVEGGINSSHHPFTAPKDSDLEKLDENPLAVCSRAYDFVINGVEIASGSIRIHERKLQEKIFSLLGIGEEESQNKFGFLLKAFEYGVPPHGGIAFGFDRLLMLLCGASSIREIIPFPKTTSGLSLMDGSPAKVSENQLEELGLKIKTLKDK